MATRESYFVGHHPCLQQAAYLTWKPVYLIIQRHEQMLRAVADIAYIRLKCAVGENVPKAMDYPEVRPMEDGEIIKCINQWWVGVFRTCARPGRQWYCAGFIQFRIEVEDAGFAEDYYRAVVEQCRALTCLAISNPCGRTIAADSFEPSIDNS